MITAGIDHDAVSLRGIKQDRKHPIKGVRIRIVLADIDP
jgi:hypothetical protein